MSVILSKMSDAFEDSGAKAKALQQYHELESLHHELSGKVRQLKQYNDSAIEGKTHTEIENKIIKYESRLKQIAAKLEAFKDTIGGSY